MKEAVTPCQACDSHGVLEDKVDKAIVKGDEAIERFKNSHKANTEEHEKILRNMGIMVNNQKWMNIIGKFLLITLLGYFVALGIYIFNNEWVTKDEIHSLNNLIQEGEILHYRNERVIEGIETKIDMLLEKP